MLTQTDRHGLETGDISLYYNPLNLGPEDGDIPPASDPEARTPVDPNSKWKRWTIAQLYTPVALTLADVAGNGFQDIIICYAFGRTVVEGDPNGGHVIWLENPGKKAMKEGKKWQQRFIGRWPIMHRLMAGHFTSS